MPGFSVMAQNAVSIDKSLQELLNYYYDLKNALVKDDTDKASESARQLLSTSKSIDAKTLSTSEQTAYASAKEAIEQNAGYISGTTNMEHQRGRFQALSLAMATLAQSVSLSQQPVYLDYCPMKKSYWLSSEKAVKNPYYGSSMLTCGKVEGTL